MFSRPFASLLLTMLAALVATSTVPARAAANLDESRLIDALADRGMRELLLYLAETGNFTDPAEPRLIEIAQHELTIRDPQASTAQRLDALQASRDAYETLLREPMFAEHPQRAVWRTDLADLLLTTYLDGLKQSATGFYEFGVTTTDQREAFEDAVPLAADQMLAAFDEFASLNNRLSQNPAMQEELKRTLALSRIYEDYRDQKSTYFAAFALYYATLLPDDHPFFARLAKVPGLPSKPGELRIRLLRQALERIAPYLREEQGNDALQKRAQSLAGRITLALGNPAVAVSDHLAPAAKANDLNLDILAASLAQAKAEEAQGRAAAGRGQLSQLLEKSAVREQLVYRLLVTDALHLLLRRMAEAAPENRRAAELERAYSVYFDLLDDPALASQADALRTLIFDRWALTLGPEASAAELAKLPPAVRMAVADISRRRGLAAMQSGNQAEAKRYLDKAIEAAATLDDRQAVGDAVWANGRFNLAFAKYAQDSSRLSSLLEVVDLLTAIAEQTPALPVATESLDMAGKIVEPLQRQYASQPGVTPAYERVMKVLYESGSFDQTQPADDRLVYYVYQRYQLPGRYAEAARMYDRQTRDHPNYLEAQGQRIFALTQVLQKTAGNDVAAVKQTLTDAITSVTDDAARIAAGGADEYQLAAAQRAQAYARLAQAEIAAADNDLDRALRVLETFETEFAQNPELIQRGLEKRILLLVDAQQLPRARDEAQRMMQKFPDAAANVINSVLSNLERQMAEAGEGSPRAAELADTAAKMAELLAQWAGRQNFTAEQMLPYHLVVVRSLRIAGKPAEALQYLATSGLDAAFANNVDVLIEKAEAMLAQGDRASLQAAVVPLNTLLSGLREPYPSTYWRAWVARLRINLKLGERVDEVPRRIDQLQQRYPDLGGEPFKSQFAELKQQAQMQR